ncbi:Arginase/agmatinase/formiminoglutamase, partial [Reticulomyxa filosa]
ACLLLVANFNQQLADAVLTTTSNHNFSIIIGGDHSIAIGTWIRIIKGLNAQEKFELIWIDAHLDAHTYEDSPSKAYHGMPVAALLGYGEEELINIFNFKPKINPKHLVYIGARSFEENEKNFLEQLGVKIYYIEEIKQRGLAQVIKEVITHLENLVKHFGVSIDLDCFEAHQAPGTGYAVENGIDFQEFYNCANLLYKHPKLKGLEIVEFNPELDVDNKTLKILITLIEQLLK